MKKNYGNEYSSITKKQKLESDIAILSKTPIQYIENELSKKIQQN